jgi:AICARFT/IMPCHase bienzyme
MLGVVQVSSISCQELTRPPNPAQSGLSLQHGCCNAQAGRPWFGRRQRITSMCMWWWTRQTIRSWWRCSAAANQQRRSAKKHHACRSVCMHLWTHVTRGCAQQAAAFRRRLAWKAFQHTATYDATVAEWMWGKVGEHFTMTLHAYLSVCCRRSSCLEPTASLNGLCNIAIGEGPPPEQCIPMTLAAGLRYGENPHQPAAFYTDRQAVVMLPSLVTALSTLTNTMALPPNSGHRGVCCDLLRTQVISGGRPAGGGSGQATPWQGDVVQQLPGCRCRIRRSVRLFRSSFGPEALPACSQPCQKGSMPGHSPSS